MLGDSPDAPSTGYALPKRQKFESHLHPLTTMEVVLKLEEVMILEPIPVTDDLQKLFQKQDLPD